MNAAEKAQRGKRIFRNSSLEFLQQFETMADDEVYQELNEAIAESFAESDWEALLQVEDPMNEQLFQELVASTREGGAILRGEAKPSRKFVIESPQEETTKVASAGTDKNSGNTNR